MREDYFILKDISVLLVEDDDSSVNELAEIFEHYFREYHRARNGKEGLELFNRFSPDIIITDLKMPTMDGISMVNEIRKTNQHVAIFIISAYADTDTFLKAFQNKISGFITKPLDVKYLLKLLLQKSQNITYEQEYKKEHELLQSVINEIPDPVMVIDLEHNILLLNQKMNTIKMDATFGKCYEIIGEKKLPCCKLNNTNMPQGTCADHHTDNAHFEVQTNPLKNKDGKIYAYIKNFHDISAHKKRENFLIRESMHDALTGLPNRKLFFDRLKQSMQRSDRSLTSFALLFLDLDNFKNINDSYGHKNGDLLLQLFAQKLGSKIRKSDTIARLSGDEFALILDSTQDREDCDKVIETLYKISRSSYELDGVSVHIHFSIGIAFYTPNTDISAQELLHVADNAMYTSKNNGKNSYSFSES